MKKTTVMRSVESSGHVIEYALRYSRRARRISLWISPDGDVVMVIPNKWQGVDIDVDGFVKKKAAWVLKKLRSAAHQKPKVSFSSGSKLPLLGNEVCLSVIPMKQRRALVRLVDSHLEIHTPATEERQVRECIVAWYRMVASHIIPQRVEQLNAAIGFRYQQVIVRDQKSRWGSCSRKGTLSFNWRLLLVPPNVMDYLIYHELAHLKEMNHSIRFWRLVQNLSPEFRDAERWLKKEGSQCFW